MIIEVAVAAPIFPVGRRTAGTSEAEQPCKATLNCLRHAAARARATSQLRHHAAARDDDPLRPHPTPDTLPDRCDTRAESRHELQNTRPVRRRPRTARHALVLTRCSRLYRQSLKLALDWSVHRYLWRGQALYLRGLFEANRAVTEPRRQRVRSHAMHSLRCPPELY